MYLNLYLIITVLTGFISITVICDQLPTCQPDDFKYSLTECDGFGGRWRVSVPVDPNKCIGGAPNAPVRADGCFVSCEVGRFFNSTSLQCQECQEGFYSLGGGVRFEMFKNESLPMGLHIKTDSIRSSLSCSGWKTNSNYLESTSNSSGGVCASVIIYTVKIVKRGKLRFTYQYSMPDILSSNILFTFNYKNYEDYSDENTGFGFDNYIIKHPSMTNEEQKWKTMEIQLVNPGLYMFVWKSLTFGQPNGNYFHPFSNSDYQLTSGSNYGIIRIKSIEIDGIAYASQCTPCGPGTFNKQKGAVSCEFCKPNTAFDKTGATECIPCDSTKEFAPRGSAKCLDKPICGKNDYYEIISECKNLKKNFTYQWIQPKICNDEKNILPPPHDIYCNETSNQAKETYQQCNAGMEMNSDGKCTFCKENYFNSGNSSQCQLCPTSTSPLYALSYTIWRYGNIGQNLPENLTTMCFRSYETRDDCDAEVGWLSPAATRNYIRTSTSALLESYLILSLPIQGFRSQSGGQISFKFEVECMSDDACELIFLESKLKRVSQIQTNVIQNWEIKGNDEKSSKIQVYKYQIEGNSTIKFSWIFKRENNFQSFSKIYEIVVTNVINGGAIDCVSCPYGSSENCVACPFGQYLDVQTKMNQNESSEIENRKIECKRCPENYIIDTSLEFAVGKNKSCIKCGPGLVSNFEKTICYSDCKFKLNNIDYDLGQMKRPLLLKGGSLFTAGGTQYFHLFNISLCGLHEVSCINNITTSGSDTFEEADGINSMICRSTIIPDGDQVLSTQSVSLGDDLIGITNETTFQNISVHPEFNNIKSDVHLYFVTRNPTAACQKGRHLTVTLRCSPELEQDEVVSTPKSCPDGTCDGCNFHFLIRTKTSAACRICQPSDYETVISECKSGIQQIHYVNPKGCILLPNGTAPIQTKHCSVIPKQVQIGIILVSSFGVILLSLVFHFWKKNRRLEYKYSKLIENEKPTECCVDEYDDDDEAEIIIKGKKRKITEENGYESIRLTHHEREDEI